MTQGIKLSSKRRALLNQLLKKKGVKITDARTANAEPDMVFRKWFCGTSLVEHVACL